MATQRTIRLVVGGALVILVASMLWAQATTPLTTTLTPGTARAYHGDVVQYQYIIANTTMDRVIPVRVELEYVDSDGTPVMDVSTAELVIAAADVAPLMWRVWIPDGADFVPGSLSLDGIIASTPFIDEDLETGRVSVALGIDRVRAGSSRTVQWQLEVGADYIPPAPPNM